MPFFSIIVPVYKVENYISKCVNSILKQRFKDYELILVDDGSPDNSGKICDKYAANDERIIVVHKKNGGVSSARNEGLKRATGQYIWFVDSDDYIEENSLQLIYNETIEYDASIFVFNCHISDYSEFNSLEIFLNDYYFSYKIGFGPCNKIYKAKLIKESGLFFDLQEKVGEDLLFNVLFYNYLYFESKLKIKFINSYLYNYVIREQSAMRNLSKYMVKNQLRLFDKIVETLKENISFYEKTYFFWLHFISGIGQSKIGGLTNDEFCSIVDFSRYQKYLDCFKKIRKQFFKNEHASFFGKLRIGIFVAFLKRKKYREGAYVMGLR